MADDGNNTQTVILDAALIEVLAHGIRRTTAADVARRSGVSRQTVYRYWPDVHALFASLVTRELLAVVPTLTSAESLDEVVTLLVTTAERIRDLPLIHRLRESDPELFGRYILKRLGTSQRRIHELITVTLVRAQLNGAVRDANAEELAAMVLLIAQSAVQSAHLMSPWLDHDAWKRELGTVLRGYLAPVS